MSAIVPFAQLPKNKNIIHRWRMEEASGTRYDSVGGMHNLNTNPSIEVDIIGYGGYSSIVSRDTVEYYHGIASLKTITQNTTASEGWQRDVKATTEVEKTYTFSLYLKGSGTVWLMVPTYPYGTTQSSLIALTNVWRRYNITHTFVTEDTTNRRLYVRTDVQQTITFYTDAVMHSEGSILYPFSAKIDLTDNNTVLSSTVCKEGNRCAEFESDDSESLGATNALSSDMGFTTENFSISFWYNPESFLAIQVPIVRGSWDASGWLCHIDTTPKITFALNTSSTDGVIVSNTLTMSTGTFYMITMVRDGNTGYFYQDSIDITSDGSFDGINAETDTVQHFMIGRRADYSSFYLDGLIDDVIIWKGIALSPSEVLQLNNLYKAKKKLIPMYLDRRRR